MYREWFITLYNWIQRQSLMQYAFPCNFHHQCRYIFILCFTNKFSFAEQTPKRFFLSVIEEFSSHIEHGEEKETSPYRRNGSKDSGVPGIEIPTQGVSKVRPGLWDNEAAPHREEAACVSLAGCSQGESSLLPLSGHEDVRNGAPFYPKVLAGGPHRAQLLADHQG